MHFLSATIPFIVNGYESARSSRARGKIPKKNLIADDLRPAGGSGFGKIFNIILRNMGRYANNQEHDQENILRPNELQKDTILRFCEGLPEDLNTHCTSMKELKTCAQKQVTVLTFVIDRKMILLKYYPYYLDCIDGTVALRLWIRAFLFL